MKPSFLFTRLLAMLVVAAALSFGVLPASVGAQDSAVPVWSDANSTQLDQFVTETMQTLNIPGTAVGIVQNGQVVYARGFGVRELGSSESVTPDTLFMIGSVTKSMTSMMMATMVDDGIISWDTPTRDIVPEFALSDPGRADTLTLRQMVCNCSGVVQRDLELLFPSDQITVPEMVQMLSQFPVSGAVGEKYNYSNQMVALGGYASTIAATDGSLDTAHDDYAVQLEQRVWEPIGMSHTTLSFDEASASSNFALPHGYDLDGNYEPIPLQVERFVVPIAPAGGTWSSVDDMARYLITQAQKGVTPDGQRIVSEENLTTTWQPQVPVAPGVDYALGWNVGHLGDSLILNHTGGTAGFSSNVTIFPGENFGLVILANAGGVAAYEDSIQTTILGLMLGLQPDVQPNIQQQIASRPSLPADVTETVDESVIAPYLGSYTHPLFGGVELRLDNGSLHLTSPVLDIELYPHDTAEGTVDLYYTHNPPLTGSTVSLVTDPSGALSLQTRLLTPDVPEGYRDETFTRID